MLHYAALHNTILHYTIPYYAPLYHTILYYTMGVVEGGPHLDSKFLLEFNKIQKKFVGYASGEAHFDIVNDDISYRYRYLLSWAADTAVPLTHICSFSDGAFFFVIALLGGLLGSAYIHMVHGFLWLDHQVTHCLWPLFQSDSCTTCPSFPLRFVRDWVCWALSLPSKRQGSWCIMSLSVCLWSS